MRYSSSQVEPVETISIRELLSRISFFPSLHLREQTCNQLPPCRNLYLDCCTGRLDLSSVQERISLWGGKIIVEKWPEILQELTVREGHLQGHLPAVDHLSLSSVVLEKVFLPEVQESLSFSQCVGQIRVGQMQPRGLSVSESDLELAGLLQHGKPGWQQRTR